ncbi:YihY/virulence factor BrkB family protein [Bradyrhizobium semiaridum]|uniref:YihY/virulence factor BrkB family protein n=1 Tax=Bradyrhizobium semiaridum TaxID=2821404 RepID=UPI0035DAF6DC
MALDHLGQRGRDRLVARLFSSFAGNFGKFNETYGSLGAAIGFMTWLWISAIVILLGAELDAEMEHQTARHDDWHGEAGGARGARMRTRWARRAAAGRMQGSRQAPVATDVSMKSDEIRQPLVLRNK